MNYNNKPKPVQANLLESMMMDQRVMGCTPAQKQHPLKVSLASCLLLTAIGTTSLLVGCGSENTAQGVDAGSTPAQPDQNRQRIATLPEQNPPPNQSNQNDGTERASSVPVAQTDQVLHGATTSNSSFIQLNALSSKVIELNSSIEELKRQQEAIQQSKPSNTVFWAALAVLFFVLLGAIFWVYNALNNSLKELREKYASLEKHIAFLNNKASTTKTKQQQPDSFSQRQILAERVDMLEEQIRQLKPRPASAQSGTHLSDNIPMLQPELSISKPLLTIDADDRQALQEAFLEWRANSRGKKIYDFLPSSFLEKIKQLGYDIVFAKAGLGLERMIIDRKPPSSTRMIGLSSTAHSIMYCHNKTYEGDECWTPDTWYEVSIDSPDAADEQTVHKGEEL